MLIFGLLSSCILFCIGKLMKRASDNMLEAQKRVPYHSGSGLMPILLDKAGLFFMLASAAAALCSALSIL